MVNKGDKKTIIITIVIVVVVVIFILIFTGNGNGTEVSEAPESEAGPASEVEPEKSMTREEVPEGIVVPEVGAEIEDETVAVPDLVAPAAPGVSAKFRRFNIVANENAFVPSEVIVNIGDTVHIDFTAIDKTYDITFPDYGMKQTVVPGEKKIFEFQAVLSGKFLYYCDLCGGLDSEVKGYIIVVPKE